MRPIEVNLTPFLQLVEQSRVQQRLDQPRAAVHADVASGRKGDNIFLKSEADYRDPRNPILRCLAKAIAALSHAGASG